MTPANGALVGINVQMPAGFPPYTPGEDYEQVPADCCGALVWAGPRQIAVKRQQPEVPLFCAVCMTMACREHGVTPKVMSMEDLYEN